MGNSQPRLACAARGVAGAFAGAVVKIMFRPASLKARALLFVLGILFCSLWALAILAGQSLYGDMRTLLNDQQFSTAKVIVSEIEMELNERLSALRLVSETVTMEMLANPVALQAYVQSKLILQNSFNAGAFIAGTDGVVLASFPFDGQIGVSIRDREYFQTVLSNNVPTVGSPVNSKKLSFPALVIAAPIRDSSGHIIGVIGGATDLSKRNFLDHVTGHAYGKTGAYMLVSAKHRVVVTASDKRRIMETLPGAGVNLVVDRFLNGYEGSLVMHDQPGEELLVSAKAIPMADWYLFATLPTTEAFGPISKLQQHVLLITLALTAIACAITWWLLSAVITPILSTVRQLADMANERSPLESLPVAGPTEIAKLIGGFNRLIQNLKRREYELLQSTAFGQAILNSIPAEIAVLNRTGVIVDLNRPWRHCATDTQHCSACRPSELGRNYLDLDPDASVGVNGEPLDSLGGIKAVLTGRLPTFTAEYPCRFAHRKAWYSMTATPLASGDGGVVISHTDITERKLAQEAMRETKQFQESVIQGVQEGIIVYGLDLRYQLWNTFMEQFTGLSADQVIGRHPLEICPFVEEADILRGLQKAIAGQKVEAIEFSFMAQGNQSTKWAISNISTLRNVNGEVIGAIAAVIDITSRKEEQLVLETTLLEKDALFKEVHHRVKNNLQVINSLLRLESGRSTQSDTRAVLDEMRGRIRSMAILHESLYRSKSLAAIDLGSYLGELAAQACSSMADRTRNINLQMDLAAIPVGMDLALPCGLLVNELISNSFKHGFPSGDGGSIRMELTAVDSGTRARLRLSDTGIGLSSDFEIGKSESLGLHLVSDLAVQINGQLEVGPGPGACFTVTFPIENLLLG